MNYEDENAYQNEGTPWYMGYGTIKTYENITKIISKENGVTLELKSLKAFALIRFRNSMI